MEESGKRKKVINENDVSGWISYSIVGLLLHTWEIQVPQMYGFFLGGEATN